MTLSRSILESAATEPRRPRWVRDRPNSHYYALATVCIGAFMGQLDASIVTAAFPTFERAFHVGVGEVAWVGIAYLVTLVALVTAAGRISDMVGRKLVYLYGFALFVAGSALCGLAPSFGLLVACRILQAVGAAMLQANSVAIIALAVPRPLLGRAIGIQGAAQALGLAMGPSIGGLLIGVGGWRLVFLVNVPVGIVALVLGWLLIPRSQELHPRVPFDLVGLGLIVPCVASLLCTVSLGDSLGWASVGTLCFELVAVASGVCLVARERHVASPLIDLSLFSRPAFSSGISSGLLSYVVLFGSMFAVPFFLERGLAMSSTRAGAILACMPVALGVTAPLAGRVAERAGARALTALGMAIAAVALCSLAIAHGSVWVIAGLLVLLGIGLGLFTPANNAAIMGAAPRRDAGVASGILNMTRGIGTALGLALTSLVLGLFAASSSASAAAVTRGFGVALACLGGVAVVAGVLAMARRGGPLELDLAASPGTG